MIPGDHLLEVGKVAKAHGLTGEVVVDLWTDRQERLAPGTSLQSDEGALVVRSSRPHAHRFLVVFEGVVGREAADRLQGLVLRAAPISDPDALWIHELVGATVVTVEGRDLGLIASVEANPASDLLVLESGALIPCNFVVDNEPGHRVTVDIPDGLVD